MAARHSITPFPAHIDRDYFGAWLSGFTDGEGCFCLYQQRMPRRNSGPKLMFSITLRHDDRAILELIRSYWQIGRFNYMRRVENHCPKTQYAISKAADLASVVVPHFEKYPLFAKKGRDFGIWKQGVDLVYHVSSKRQKGAGPRKGMLPKWTEGERVEFEHLQVALREQRKFESAGTQSPNSGIPAYHAQEMMLF